jgi:diguanylate cyclase (GGDEF)-like protein
VRETDIAGRLGGDEFGVILARADEATAETKARALAELIAARPLVIGGENISLSISVGTVAFTGDDEPQDALARADRAMYRAKRRLDGKPE